jgi:ribosomal protein S18 acetylase RimI-like enzyme
MLIDIKHRLNEKAIAAILSECLYEPTEARLNKIAGEYLAGGNRFMLGYEWKGEIIGCAGIELREPGSAALLHIAVDPACRGQGVGRAMIDGIMQRFGLRRLEAETDDDAVGFYRNCGFEIVHLGEKYPGVMRYLCIHNK